MRKIFLLCLLLFVFSGLHSQDFIGGFNLGIAASQVSGDNYGGFNKAGPFGGVWAEAIFTPKSGFRMEIGYVQKGSRQNPKEENGFNQYLFRLHYAELPFLYKYYYNDVFHFEVGLAYGYLIDYFEEVNHQEASSAEMNRHNLNFILGLYYNLNDRWQMNFRTNNSITPLRPHTSGAKRLFNSGQYNDALILSLVYTFNRRTQ